MKFIYIIITTYVLLADGYYFEISPISSEIKKRMTDGKSWKSGCPVGLKELRYLKIKHWNFNGTTSIGELIVHVDISQNISTVFKELYNMHYPIKQMRLVSDFKGSDWKSIEADNTSALNCRNVTGNKNRWSKHAYGKAIDINPIENPYISRRGYISHKASLKYKKRFYKSSNRVENRALLFKNSKATKIFEKYGWKWGGDWKNVKDYQHFEYKK